MCRGRNAVLPHGHTARLSDLGRDLRGGQHPPVSGLGALRQLDLDHLDLVVGGLFGETPGVEHAVGRPAAEIARPDLPDQIAAARDCLTENGGLHGGSADAPSIGINVAEKGVAWRRLTVHGTPGHGSMPFKADTLVPDQDPEIVVRKMLGLYRMGQPRVSRVIDTLLRAEGALVLDPLGALIDDRALLARERLLVLVALDQVLPDLGADALEEKAHVAENGIVPQDRVVGLGHVPDADGRERRKRRHRQPEPRTDRDKRQRDHRQHHDQPKRVIPFVRCQLAHSALLFRGH